MPHGRGLAMNCDFAANALTKYPRDEFMLGMTSGSERDHLYGVSMEKLTFEKAFESVPRGIPEPQCSLSGTTSAALAGKCVFGYSSHSSVRKFRKYSIMKSFKRVRETLHETNMFFNIVRRRLLRMITIYR